MKGPNFPSASQPNGGLDQKSSGSMNYTEVQDKFSREDASKIKRGEYKNNRYK